MNTIEIKPKHCWMCDQFFPRTTEYFHKNRTQYGGGFSNTCKQCKQQLNLKHYRNRQPSSKPRINTEARNKKHIWSVKEQGCCVFCGEQRPEVLHFHHTEPKEKIFTLSRPRSRSLEEIKMEIVKCDLLCANCHVSLHYWEKHK